MANKKNVPAQNTNSAEVSVNFNLSFTAFKKALGAVFNETCKFKQACRVFDGMGAFPVPTSKNSTIRFDELVGTIGIQFKGGRLDPESLKKAWRVMTADNYMALYKSVPGYEAVEGDEEKSRKVYVWNEEKAQYEGVSVTRIVAVEKWNASLILEGILQSAFTARYIDEAAKTQKAWDEYEGELYVFDKVQDKDGITNKRHIIRKTQVEF